MIIIIPVKRTGLVDSSPVDDFPFFIVLPWSLVKRLNNNEKYQYEHIERNGSQNTTDGSQN